MNYTSKGRGCVKKDIRLSQEVEKSNMKSRRENLGRKMVNILHLVFERHLNYSYIIGDIRLVVKLSHSCGCKLRSHPKTGKKQSYETGLAC